MQKKILFGCYEVPGFGGASTATYQLVRKMQQDGFHVGHINIIDEEDADYFRYIFGETLGNPSKLANVYNCVLQGTLYGPHHELTCLLKELNPDLLIGVDLIASLLMKQAAPDVKLIFMTAGCQTAQEFMFRNGIKDFTSQKQLLEQTAEQPRKLNVREQAAVLISDVIIAHSEMTQFLYRYFFPFQAGKVYSRVIWFAEWIYEEALAYAKFKRTFDERDIDVLFVSSLWSRPEKNYELVKQLIRRLSSAHIHIVGEVAKRNDQVTYHGLLVEREELFMLMGRAKTLVCPSLFDAAPGILYEASAMGCNIVVSKNCGNWRICNEKLLVDPFSVAQFERRIRLALSEKFEDHMNFFLQTNSYQHLIEMILVL